MRYGYWVPVFGGWLRNVDDEREASWENLSRLVKPSAAAAPAAITQTIKLMVAVRPNFHRPALFARTATLSGSPPLPAGPKCFQAGLPA